MIFLYIKLWVNHYYSILLPFLVYLPQRLQSSVTFDSALLLTGSWNAEGMYVTLSASLSDGPWHHVTLRGQFLSSCHIISHHAWHRHTGQFWVSRSNQKVSIHSNLSSTFRNRKWRRLTFLFSTFYHCRYDDPCWKLCIQIYSHLSEK